MQAREVLGIVGALKATNLQVWIDGGWGVDALLHEVTRPHEDLDLVVELNALPQVFEKLATLGFSVVEDLSPVRVVLSTPDGRQIDLHPVTFDEDGTGWQVGASPDGSDCQYAAVKFAIGEILGEAVPCLNAELQLEHHSGYEPRDRDRKDMAHLADRFGLELPSSF